MSPQINVAENKPPSKKERLLVPRARRKAAAPADRSALDDDVGGNDGGNVLFFSIDWHVCEAVTSHGGAAGHQVATRSLHGTSVA